MNGAGKFHPAPAREMPWLIISVLICLMDGLVPVHFGRKNSRLVRSCVSLLIVCPMSYLWIEGAGTHGAIKGRLIGTTDNQLTYCMYVLVRDTIPALSPCHPVPGLLVAPPSGSPFVPVSRFVPVSGFVPVSRFGLLFPPLSVSVCVLLVPFSSACLLSLLA